MLSFSPRSLLSLTSLLVAAVTFTSAKEFRQVYSYTGGDGKAFCAKWKCACINYEPSDKSLVFNNAYCTNGNYPGKDLDKEAVAYCAFGNRNGSKSVSKHIATAVNGTLVPDY